MNRPNRFEHYQSRPSTRLASSSHNERRIPDMIWFTEDEQGRTWCSFREGPASKGELEEIIRLATLARETALSETDALHARERDCNNPACQLCEDRYWEGVADEVFVDQVPPKIDAHGVVYLAKSGDSYKLGCTTNSDLRNTLSQVKSKTRSTITLIHSAPSTAIRKSKYRWLRQFVRGHERGDWFRLSPAEVGEFRAWGGDVE